MSKIDYQTLRERYSPKPAPECSVCGEEMSMQRISSGTHIVYACTGEGDDGYFKTGRTFADEHYLKSRVTVVDVSDPDVLALLDELDAAKNRIAEMEANLAVMAAENELARKAVQAFCDVVGDNTEVICEEVGRDGVLVILEAMKATGNMPATDAFLAEVRAEARNEGINYTASRLAAAFNHGFINKSLREVFDVTRMILSAKEELANEVHPIDGLSGEYAEKSLEEWAEQIRKGGIQ
ncbi:ead/Ea22-like family protein [Escherichia coli]|uniref:ead/Ea22-like family protein n=1 Tax=Escherichia coli TaxID=562 RepID=UPI000F0BC536|nr:ead/Ea22-like family protein [Escherichia coli]